MERDFGKFADWLAENARAGVVIEEKILEWKLAERKLHGESVEEQRPQAKAS